MFSVVISSTLLVSGALALKAEADPNSCPNDYNYHAEACACFDNCNYPSKTSCCSRAHTCTDCNLLGMCKCNCIYSPTCDGGSTCINGSCCPDTKVCGDVCGCPEKKFAAVTLAAVLTARRVYPRVSHQVPLRVASSAT